MDHQNFGGNLEWSFNQNLREQLFSATVMSGALGVMMGLLYPCHHFLGEM
jgi:hypothetical protein